MAVAGDIDDQAAGAQAGEVWSGDEHHRFVRVLQHAVHHDVESARNAAVGTLPGPGHDGRAAGIVRRRGHLGSATDGWARARTSTARMVNAVTSWIPRP